MKRELYLPYFQNKKVTVLGLGLLGRGVGDTKFLAECGADLIVTDKKTKEELTPSVAALSEFPKITYRFGEHQKADFENRDFILKAAGVTFDNEFIQHAQKHGVPIYMSASLMSDIVMKNLEGVTIIGVTGTRGKSTTTQLIAHILRSANSRIHLGGNIRGIANLPLLSEIEDGEYLVLELDSWQLQGFGDQKISPHIAVFASFMDDHMNYYKNDKERYFEDKAHIYRHQKEGDVLIASAQAAGEILMREKHIQILVPEQRQFEMQLIGEHNQTAANLAYEVAIQCGLDDDSIREAIHTFKAVDGRLEDMGIHRGVRVFNDNNATTPDAVIAGIKSINETYGVKPILIMGGADKGLPLEALEQEVLQGTKAYVLLSGTGTDTLSLPKTNVCSTLADCIGRSFELASPGDIILFSPGFASFGKEFNNEYERHDKFVEELKKYV
jgi:UDP-N-acetylmuramoylalanine--D-glutamate ligase